MGQEDQKDRGTGSHLFGLSHSKGTVGFMVEVKVICTNSITDRTNVYNGNIG